MADTFYVHNTTRSPHTRELRRALVSPESSTKNLFLAGGLLRVVRGRPSPVTESFLRRHLRELIEKEKKGLLMVLDARSRRVNLDTLQPGEVVHVEETTTGEEKDVDVTEETREPVVEERQTVPENPVPTPSEEPLEPPATLVVEDVVSVEEVVVTEETVAQESLDGIDDAALEALTAPAVSEDPAPVGTSHFSGKKKRR